MTNAFRLRESLQGPDVVVLPGVHDVLSAKIIKQAGFDVAFTSGLGLSASALSVPDIELLAQTETLDGVRRVVDAVSIPVIAAMVRVTVTP